LSLASILFAFAVRPLGMFPTVAVGSFLAASANRQFRPFQAALVSLVIAAFCVLVFVQLIGLQIPVFGSVLGYD